MLAALFGFLFGFIGSMPMAGPIGALILGKSLDGRLRTALHIGLGAAVAEGLYAVLAFLGFSVLLADYPFMVPASRIVAAVMLFALGFNFILRKRLPKGVRGEDLARPLRSALVGFTITAINASLLATWGVAAASSMSMGGLESRLALSIPFGLGAALGIASWYVVLVGLVRKNLHRFEVRSLGRLVRGMGVVLVGLGISFVVWTGIA